MVTDSAPKLRQAFDDMMTSRVNSSAVEAVDNVNSVTPSLQHYNTHTDCHVGYTDRQVGLP